MGTTRFRLADGVVVEEVGDDLMVMVHGSTEILSLSGAAADAVRKTQAGESVTIDAVSEDLIRAGVLETSAVSRRGFITAGAIGAGAGIAVLSMPGVAAASSTTQSTTGASCQNPDFTGIYTERDDTFTILAPAINRVELFLAGTPTLIGLLSLSSKSTSGEDRVQWEKPFETVLPPGDICAEFEVTDPLPAPSLQPGTYFVLFTRDLTPAPLPPD
jgi:hypothetical protein